MTPEKVIVHPISEEAETCIFTLPESVPVDDKIVIKDVSCVSVMTGIELPKVTDNST